MSKFAKVQMANILGRAGYGKIKILNAIRYPKCNQIGLVSIETSPPPESVEIKIFGEDSKVQSITLTDLGETQILETPVYSGMSHCDFGVDLTLDFFYGARFNNRLFGHFYIEIPHPPEWPIPDFLTIKDDAKT